MFHTLKLAAKLGVITTAHCENAELVGQLQQLLLAEGKTGPEWHEPSRPEAVEAEGTTRFATFVEQTGATGYVVHLSCAPALRAAVDAKMRGVKLHIESVLPHFLLDKSYAERAGVEGMKHVMSPPLRDKRNLPVLWNALKTGLIETVGTDHCPFDTEQKLMGAKAFTQIPNGIPGIEDRVNLMYTYGVKRGGLDIHRFVDALSTEPPSSSASTRAREPSLSERTPIWLSMTPSIAAKSPLPRSTASTTTTALKASRSKAGPPWSPCAARCRRAMAPLWASRGSDACCAANRNVIRKG
jgi:dihydroorotase-like cyclic amidohydrolase